MEGDRERNKKVGIFCSYPSYRSEGYT